MPEPFALFIPGRAKTKGSVNAWPNGTVYQNVQGSKRWAKLMAKAAHQCWAGREPLTGPLYSSLSFVLAGDPIATGAGDMDKLVRNVWDALKVAGVIADDVLFVSSCESKRQSNGPADPVGVHVAVGRLAS